MCYNVYSGFLMSCRYAECIKYNIRAFKQEQQCAEYLTTHLSPPRSVNTVLAEMAYDFGADTGMILNSEQQRHKVSSSTRRSSYGYDRYCLDQSLLLLVSYHVICATNGVEQPIVGIRDNYFSMRLCSSLANGNRVATFESCKGDYKVLNAYFNIVLPLAQTVRNHMCQQFGT